MNKIIYISVTPEFPTVFPRDLNASAGGNLTLGCIAIGQPEPNITWYKDGREIAGAVTIKQQRMTSSSLTLLDVDSSDVGVYWCNATNFLFEFLETMSPTGALSIHCECSDVISMIFTHFFTQIIPM